MSKTGKEAAIPAEPHVAIIGAGALGLLYGARFAAAGIRTSFIARSEEQCALLASAGLELCEGGDCASIAGVNAFTSLAAVPPPDLVLVTVKSPATSAAVGAVAPYIPDHCPVLTLQNGLNNVEAIAAALDPGQVLAGVSYNGATRLGPARVLHAGRGDTVIGELSGEAGARVQSVAGLFRRAGLSCSVSADITGLIWEKLMVNAAINPVAALTRQTNGVLAASEEAVTLMNGLVAEAVRVAAAVGVELDEKACMDRVIAVGKATSGNLASMLQDVLAGRGTEIMHINGAIAALGSANGVECPLNAAVTGLVRLLEPCAAKNGK